MTFDCFAFNVCTFEINALISGPSSVRMTPQREHSRKPDELYHRIERYVSGEGPFLEWFARQSRLGWTTWGLEKTKFDPPGTSELT